MRIRRATVDDAAVLSDLASRTFTETFGHLYPAEDLAAFLADAYEVGKQKVILSRWLATDPAFLILDEPTRGIDVGAHAEIVRTINRLRDEGLALVVISSELDEVVAYSSRIVVMRDREMVAELSGENINPGVIVQAIANHRDEEVA